MQSALYSSIRQCNGHWPRSTIFDHGLCPSFFFQDAICFKRYNFTIPNRAAKCICCELNTVDHTLICKTKEDYSLVISNIRTRLSMDIMRSVLVGVRGTYEGKQRRPGPPLYPVSPSTSSRRRSKELRTG